LSQEQAQRLAGFQVLPLKVNFVPREGFVTGRASGAESEILA
jgi:hypothetical protein